jgi:hypothetical protein
MPIGRHAGLFVNDWKNNDLGRSMHPWVAELESLGVHFE